MAEHFFNNDGPRFVLITAILGSIRRSLRQPKGCHTVKGFVGILLNLSKAEKKTVFWSDQKSSVVAKSHVLSSKAVSLSQKPGANVMILKNWAKILAFDSNHYYLHIRHKN
jgi:hypothetical protein